ncbi:MAG: SDR family NAD(P)-dependent oxidoreductase [Alphaproteobacteria bacterium]|nr:SDR family NAD(P)-dependent oxidoreductase [Alphaproteobacteria bacterium]
MAEPTSALIVGVGEGLGAAIARRFAAGGLKVALAARRRDVVERLAAGIPGAHGYAVDARDEAATIALLDRVEADLGPLAAAVYNPGANTRGSILDFDATLYRKVWELCCFGGFLLGREAARRMVPRGQGTILFTGATASLRGGNGYAAFAGGKFALRALAQSMARELGPKGIHVGHVVIDGVIDTPRTRERFGDAFKTQTPDAQLKVDDIAEAYWQLHVQKRSAWTLELDLRPWVEKF